MGLLLSRLGACIEKPSYDLVTITKNQFYCLRQKQYSNFINFNVFLKLVTYNTRNGLKLKTLNLYLHLVQIFFKIFKMLARKRKRRINRNVKLKLIELLFQRTVDSRQLLLTQGLKRKRDRHKVFEYKFFALYKNKRVSHLMRWLRLLSFACESRRYITRMVYVYYNFLFFNRNSYVYKVHRSLRKEYFLKKKKKSYHKKITVKRVYLGKLANI